MRSAGITPECHLTRINPIMSSIHPQETNGCFGVYYLSRKRCKLTFSVLHDRHGISSFTHPHQCRKALKQFLLMPGRSLHIYDQRPLQILSVDQRCHDLKVKFLSAVLCIFYIRIKFCAVSEGVLYFYFFHSLRKLLTFRESHFFHRGQYFFHVFPPVCLFLFIHYFIFLILDYHTMSSCSSQL